MKTTPLGTKQGTARNDTLVCASVLVPLDGSRLAAQAIPQAVELARSRGARLVLLSVLSGENAIPSEKSSAPPSREQDARRYQSEGYLQALKRSLQGSGVNVETRVEAGPAAATIVRVGRALDRACLVIAAHGKTASRGDIIAGVKGAVVEQVLLEWAGPLLVVEPQDEAAWSL